MRFIPLAVGLLILFAFAVAMLRGARRAGPAGARRIRDSDVVRVVLKLDPAVVDELFGLYAKEFGAGAARYARRTRRKWEAGEVRANRRTFERLLVRLPDLMSFDLKCEVLRKLREEFCPKDDYELKVGAGDWRATVAPLVESLVRKSYAAELPRQIERRLKWLAADDMRVARAILAESQARESRNALELLEREFAEIARLLETGGGRSSRVTHTIKLPSGTITLKVKGG
ncbi:MAG TPA: hypothetical protein VF588_18065 [Pyrinomonadaceae bacterium]|jgi:hypothetical protein